MRLQKVRTRIAPSPTGKDLHIGNLYTALINWAWARKNKGDFIVRIEDTDRTRLVKGAEERILRTLKDYGLKYDEGPDVGGRYGPYRQSERLGFYRKYAQELIKKGAAYYCFCSRERLSELRKKLISQGKIPKYDRYCLYHEKSNANHEPYQGDRPYVIRLKVPDKEEIVFNDLIRGEIRFKARAIDDQVLLKSDGYPTYHLAVVVDDYLMKISHVIRAEEWISSTPKHILLYRALGWDPPIYVHLPILRNPDKSKLSKRKNPVWGSWYLRQGYLPEAVLNYLSLMGWSHPEEKEIFSLKEFIRSLDLKDIAPVGPSFDPVKLEWFNGQYIRKTQNPELKTKILNFYHHKYPEEVIKKTIPLIKERIKKLSDYLPLCRFFFSRPESYDIDLSPYKPLFKKISLRLAKIKRWKGSIIGKEMEGLASQQGLTNSKLFMLLRVAITGKKVTPPLNQSMEILGKSECLARIKKVSKD